MFVFEFICRFATVLFYLNDVEEGGATAFPVAGNETYGDKVNISSIILL